MLDPCLNDQNCSQNIETGHAKLQQYSKTGNGNSSAIHPMRSLEDENLDYDSNASSSSFEFHKGERVVHNSMRSYPRPMSSKWNDAEKWIINRQNLQASYAKKTAFQNQANRFPMSNTARVAPDSANYDLRSTVNRTADAKRFNFYQSAVQMPFEKFSFNPSAPHPSKDLSEVGQMDLSCTKSSEEDTKAFDHHNEHLQYDVIKNIEMVGSCATVPYDMALQLFLQYDRPASSIPSTPCGGEPTSMPLDDESQHPPDYGKKELSEQEIKLKTRRKIVALGVQLGKMNIAAWASKDDKENKTTSVDATHMKELGQMEYEQRAAAWEESEKSKHTARYKREEIKIHAWESQQREKIEAEMRRIEEKVEQMRAQAEEKIVKKIAMAKQRSEEKRTATEARKNRDAERTSAQVEYIRRTGRMPSSRYMCCGW
ncbi:putative Auxin response factor [Hibiscus syriacus]|uniref:Auxin response factor n=1 Tax=Hibiscus syriacus TaxID=106335 RepID=A0A6A3D4V1_HIBSY|nr:putative Auxin response factor [Hibiscus syriacus]